MFSINRIICVTVKHSEPFVQVLRLLETLLKSRSQPEANLVSTVFRGQHSGLLLAIFYRQFFARLTSEHRADGAGRGHQE